MAKARTSQDAASKRINLALQGGGSHGAFTWGALDYILEDGRLDIEGISATSAGAVNAVVLAQGMLGGDREKARETLHNFWHSISRTGDSINPFRDIPKLPWLQSEEDFTLDDSPLYYVTDYITRAFSPYQLNPTNYNPLKELLEEHVDFQKVMKETAFKLNICATNLETCKPRIFKNHELSVDVVIASACLPFLFQAVEIDNKYYWDGGYLGNPAIYPLIYHCNSTDVVIVHINPIKRAGVPTTAHDILNRINEVSFNSSLMREMRSIAFVSKLKKQGKLKRDEMKDMLIHSIRSDETMADYSVSSKLNTQWRFLTHLRDEGREVTRKWLNSHYSDIGMRSSVDISNEFL